MNRVVKAVWTSWVKPLIIYGLLWAGFHYWLDFNQKQSIVFSLIVGGGYFWLKELSKAAGEFIPYTVSVKVKNWYDLLFKYKFVKSEEEWKLLCEKAKDSGVFRRGFNFTVLSMGRNGLPHLLWWDDHKMFLAGIPSFEEPIGEIQFRVEPPMSWEWSPRLYFGYLHGGKQKGYTLALCVREEWWEKNKTPETAAAEISKEPHTASVYLILATLPYGEIGLDYERRGEERKKELTERGWIVRDFHEPEVPNLDSIAVENQFCSVSHQFRET
jgi:hypothetical protein